MEEQTQDKEQFTVKAVDDNTPAPSAQEREAEVLEKAVESGEVDEKYSPKEVDGVVKVDLDKFKEKEEDAIQERETKEIPVGERTGDSQEVDGEVRVESDKEDTSKEEKVEESDGPLELINEKEEEEVKEIITPSTSEKVEQKQEKLEQVLPENVDKLVKFMEETGGTVEDYVNLNRDVSKMDNVDLLREYYRTTKPHLDANDVDFLFNKNFGYDGETDDPSDVKAKQLAFKEELYNAQNHFKTSREKYYADLKLRKQESVDPEYAKAMEYYQSSLKKNEDHNNLQQTFLKKTDDVFSDKFKGFDFKVGENKYRFKVDDAKKVKEYQSDMSNFVGEFLDKDGAIGDAQGYHRAMFAAKNADKIANHFYEQGRADAIRSAAKDSKNINMSPRQDNMTNKSNDQPKVRAVQDNNPNKLRVKWK
tara:strand:- start:977 stop:2239 length:1263 start_codon:yes stop_codon:yes gene_type:complete